MTNARWLVCTWLIAMVGCASQPDIHDCSTGILCPAPLQCAAVQKICITNDCGNGRIDPGEQCDDGNITNGDGCSSSCQKEFCGNGIVDPGEQCDPPGSVSNGVPCSATCQFEVCGNGVIDHETSPPEQCDDGTANTNTPCPTPAYSNPPSTCSTCTKSCTINTVEGPYCGNGICDTADGETITTCMEDCSGCGNGILDTGEECDNGSANTNTPCTETTYANPPATCTTCTKNCTISTVLGPYCGDGTCSNGETKTSCPIDCSGCGNGIVSGTEQCDDGSNNTNTACTTPAYDTANPSVPLSCSTCTLSCTVDTVFGPFCGDHICQAANETAATCPADCGCGNGIINTGEQCDNGANNSNTCGPPAYDTAMPNVPLTCSTCTTSCTLLTIEGPYCGDGSCSNGETETSCPVDCHGCGNGIVEGSEQCDDGSNNTNTACATPAYHNPPLSCSTCTLSCTVDTVFGPFCGDHVCETAFETATSCPADCGCGNGIINTGEQCDNGANNTNTPCTTPAYNNPPLSCSTCTTSCTVDTVFGPYCGDLICETSNETATSCATDCGCGNGIINTGEQCDDGGSNTDTPCTTPAYHNPPLTCSTCTTSCAVDTVTGPFCGDHICQAADETSITCPADCGCGNGVLNTGEQCDNGAANTDTACTVTTYANPPDTCSYCTTSCDLVTVLGPYCGDGIQNGTEQCDGTDGIGGACPGIETGAVCTSQCTLDLTGCM